MKKLYILLFSLFAFTSSFAQDIVINEILYDPNGDANGDGVISSSEDEFVELYNTGLVAIDLTGYTLEDNVLNRHTFPSGTILDPESFITVFAGGTPTGINGITQVASSGFLGLNNGGDNVTLRNSEGTLIANYDYPGTTDDQSIAREPDFTGSFIQHLSITSNPVMFSPGENNDGSFTLSINQFEILELGVYPNPTNGEFYIVFETILRDVEIYITDVLGKQISSLKYKNANKIKLELTDKPSGIYFVNIKSLKGKQNIKLIKK